MLDQLTKRFKQYTKIAGLEILIKPDQSYAYKLVILEKKKSKISILDTYTDIQSLDALGTLEEITSLPIAVVLNGKSILSKQINNANLSSNNLVASVIPNANAEEFSYQIYRGEASTWISMIRKELLEKIIKDLSKVGLSLVDLSLGVFEVQNIVPLLSDQEIIETTAYELEISNKKIAAFSTKKTNDLTIKYRIGEEEINNQLTLAFSKAFSNLLGITPEIMNAEFIEEEEENYVYTNLFQKLKWGGLVGIFGLLLINFMVFNYLNNKNQKTGVQLSMHQSQLDQLKKLKSQYQEKQTFFNQASVLKPSKTSWYADQIATSIQEGIQLQQIKIAPSINKKKRRIDQEYRFDNKKILIKGQSQKSNFLNTWINDLQDLEWIEKISVLPYSEEKNGRGAFELEVIINSVYKK